MGDEPTVSLNFRVKTVRDMPARSASAARVQRCAGLSCIAVIAAAICLSAKAKSHPREGLITFLVAAAREKGISAYVGGGLNRWPAVHRLDAARLYRLVLEKGTGGASYHGVAEEGVPTRDIAEAIGRGLNVPVVSKSSEEAADHFGWIARFFGIDGPASSAQTQGRLGWRPVQPGLITDLSAEHYFQHAADAVPLHS